MSRELDYYEKKVRDLQIENDVLRGQLLSSSKSYRSVAPETIFGTSSMTVELNSKNERMERQASKYEKSIKMDLSSYLADSMVQGECYYRDRYNKLLTQPKNHYRLYL